MADEEKRQFNILLDFLPEGSYTATIWQDAVDAIVDPTHLDKFELLVDRNTVIEAKLAPAGGHVMVIREN
jgi:hypothetical protein